MRFNHKTFNAISWRVLVKGRHLLLGTVLLHRLLFKRQSRLVMVVGSYGKTSTTRAIRAVFGLPEDTWSHLNANTWGEIPFMFWRHPFFSRHRVLEVGIGAPGEMPAFTRHLRPNIVVVTGIGREHLNRFHTIENIRREKSKALGRLGPRGIAVLNADDENVVWMASQTRAKIHWFGSQEHCHVRLLDCRWNWPHGMTLHLRIAGAEHELNVPLIGKTSVTPVLAALTTALAEGLSIDDALQSLSELRPARSRLEVQSLPNGAIAIRDEYKTSIDTVISSISTLREVPAHRRWLLLSPLEDSSTRDIASSYREVAETLAGFDGHVIICGDDTRQYQQAFDALPHLTSPVFWVDGYRAAVSLLQRELRAGDVLLLKSEENFRLARILLSLLGAKVNCPLTHCGLHRQFCDDCASLSLGH